VTEIERLRKAVRDLLELLDDADVTFNSSWEPHRAERCYSDAVNECRALSYPWMDKSDWAEIEATANVARAS